MEEQANAALRKVTGRDEQPVGCVRVATVEDLAIEVLPPIVASFREEHPRVTLARVARDAHRGAELLLVVHADTRKDARVRAFVEHVYSALVAKRALRDRRLGVTSSRSDADSCWGASRWRAIWCELACAMTRAGEGQRGPSRLLRALPLASLVGACAGAGVSAPRDAAVERAVAAGDAPTDDAPRDHGAVAMYRDILRRIRLAACQRAQRCGTFSAPTVNLCMASSQRFAVEPDPPRLAMQLAGLERGEFTLTPSALDACLDAMSRSCDLDFVVGDVAAPACLNFVHGSGAAGASCVATEACAPGLRCRIATGDGGTGCPGTCAPPAVGDPCSGGACGTLSCGLQGRCVDAPLIPPRSGDNRCGANVVAAGYVTCPAGQVCTRGVEVNFYCRAPSCDPPCGPDAVCDFATRRCLDAELLGPGAACGSMRQACDPRRGLRCDANDRCAPRVEAGGACQGDDCAAGLTCRELVCRRPDGTTAVGAPCFFDGDCASGACVDRMCRGSGCFP